MGVRARARLIPVKLEGEHGWGFGGIDKRFRTGLIIYAGEFGQGLIAPAG